MGLKREILPYKILRLISCIIIESVANIFCCVHSLRLTTKLAILSCLSQTSASTHLISLFFFITKQTRQFPLMSAIISRANMVVTATSADSGMTRGLKNNKVCMLLAK